MEPFHHLSLNTLEILICALHAYCANGDFSTQSEYLCLTLVSIQLKWTHFLYLSKLSLVLISFLQSSGDIFVQSGTLTGTDLALWLCKLLEVPQNNRLFSDYLLEQYYLSPDTCTQFVLLHRCDTLYSYSSNHSFHF